MKVHYTSIVSTTLTAASATGTFGGTVELTATIAPAVVGKTIAFTLNGASAGSAVTNASGVATVAGASLAGINANTYATGVGASFAGDATHGASSDTDQLTVNPKAITVTADAKSKTFGQADPAFTYVSSDPAAPFTGTLSRVAGEDFGAYAITIGSLSAGGNYTITFVSTDLTINRADQTITFGPLSGKTFGDAPFTVTATASSGLPVAFSVSGPATIDGNTVTITGAGMVTVTASQEGGLNYNAATPIEQSFEVVKADQTIDFGVLANKTFGDPSFDLSATASSGLTVEFTVLSGPAFTTGNTLNITGVGTVVVRAFQDGNGNFNAATPVEQSFEVTPKAVVITPNAGQSTVYGFSEPPFTFTNDAGLEPSAFTGGLGREPGNNVGNYAFTLGSLTAGPNYTLSLGGSNTFRINPRAITVVADAKTKVFGSDDPALTSQVVGVPLVAGDGFSGALERAAGQNVGIYAIGQGTLTAGENYTITFVPANFEITPMAVVVTPNAGQSKVFGAVEPGFLFTNDAGLAVADFTGALDRAAGENVGLYAFGLGNLSAGANYSLSLGGAVTFEITAKPITVSTNPGQTKVFGQTDPVFTYSSTDPAAPFTGALSRVSGEDVGTYAITQGDLSAGANYAITFVPANFEITPKGLTVTVTAGQSKVFGQTDPVFAYTSSEAVTFTGALQRAAGEDVGKYVINQGNLSAGANYAITFQPDEFEITKANATIVVNGWSGVYDGNAHGATGTATGVNGADLNAQLTLGDSFTNVPGGTAFWGFNGGTNYNNAAGSVEIIVTKADAAITVTGYNVTFDGAAHTATGTANGVKGEALSGLDLSATTHTNAGNYPSDAWTFTDSTGNYNNASGTVADAIGQAAATVNVTGYTGVYDGDAHGATGTATGVGGAPLTGLDLGVSFTNVPGGTANWTFTNDNYASQNGSVEIVITKADATISVTGYDVTFDGEAHTATGTVTGVKGEALTGLDLTATTHIAAGTYATDAWTFTGGTNYNDANGTVSDNIGQKAVTVSANPQAKAYGADNPTLTATVIGAIGGTPVNYSLATTAVKFSPVGSYPIAVTLGENPNYTVTAYNSSLAIGKAAVTVTVVADAKAKAYGEVNPTLTAVVTGALNDDVIAYSLATTAAQFSPVGDYPITVTLGENPNYNVTKTDAVLTVGKAAVTVTVVADAKAKVYGEANPELTAVVTGALPGGDAINYTLDTTALTLSPVGDYPITVTLGSNPNYTVTKTDAVLSIGKVAIEVTADDKTKVFGDDDPALTFQITDGKLVEGEDFTGAITREAGEDVETYEILQGTLELSNNYELTFVPGKFIITQAEASFTFDVWSGIYDALPHGASGTAEGVNEEDLSSLLHVADTTYTNVPGGPVAWTFDGNQNYKPANGVLTVVIGKANQTIDFPALPAATYGDPAFPIIATASSGLTVSFEVVSGPATVSGNMLTLTGIGNVLIRASQAGDINFNPAASVEQQLIANQYKLVIITAPQTFTEDGVSGMMTVQIQDGFNNPVIAGTVTTVNLSTDSATGKFGLNGNGLPVITTVTIFPGTSAASFYYLETDATDPDPVVTVSSAGMTPFSQAVTVQPKPVGPSQIVITNATIPAFTEGGVSGIITVQAQKADGTPVNVTGNTTVNLSTTGTTGAFGLNSNGLPVVNSVTIFAGTNSASFYYTNTKAGTYTIEVSSVGLTGDDRSVTVNAKPVGATKVVFLTAEKTVKKGRVTSMITIQLQDASGNVIKASKNTVITLTAPSGGSFGLNGNGLPVVTTVTIYAGTSSASFYYRAPGTTGDFTITISSPDLTGASQVVHVIP